MYCTVGKNIGKKLLSLEYFYSIIYKFLLLKIFSFSILKFHYILLYLNYYFVTFFNKKIKFV